MIKVNKRMRELLIKNKISEESLHQYGIMKQVANPKVIEIQDCILIDDGSIDRKTFDIEKVKKAYYDRTGFEAFHNHIHIDSSLSKKRNSSDKFILALNLLNEWEGLLIGIFPIYRFHIVLSINENHATLRFYKLRDDEDCWISINNLNGYQHEAILVKEVGGS